MSTIVWKLTIMRQDTGLIYLAFIPWEDGKPDYNRERRITNTTEELVDFYVMLKQAIEGKRPEYVG